MSERRGERSKNDTWGEQELAKYIGGEGKEAAKKRLSSTDPRGSPKTNPKARVAGTSLIKKDQGHSIASSSSRNSTTPHIKKPSITTGTKSTGRLDLKSKPVSSSSKPENKKQVKESSGRSKPSYSHDSKSSKSSTEQKLIKPAPKPQALKPRTEDRSRGRPVDKGKPLVTDPRTSRGKIGSINQRKVAPKRGEEQIKKPNSRPREEQHKVQYNESKSQSLKPSGGYSKEMRESSGDRGRDKKSHGEDLQGYTSESTKSPVEEQANKIGPDQNSVGNLDEEERSHDVVEMIEDLGEEYHYEDEFEEDYEEDFEEILEEDDSVVDNLSSPSEEVPTTPTDADVTDVPSAHSRAVVKKAMDLVEIMQAIDSENQMVENSAPSLTKNTDLDRANESTYRAGQEMESAHKQEVNTRGLNSSLGRKFVDFSSAQKRTLNEKVTKKARKRGQELLSMIELDIVTYDMFDLPPLSEYEVYVKKFGAGDTRQVSVQTGEDNVNCEVQTDPITTNDKWVQWPPEDLRGYGGPSLDTEEDEQQQSNQSKVIAKFKDQDTSRLASFLKRAREVCSVLLEENLITAGVSSYHSTKSPFPFCSSSLVLQAFSTLSDRYVTHISHCFTKGYLFLASYSLSLSAPTASSDHKERNCVNGKGVVCVWSTREPSQPQRILVCQSSPSCCCFSPQKSSMAFAGNEDGSVVVWDLREPVNMHRQWTMCTDDESSLDQSLDLVPRVPTFSTAGILHLDNHQSPVVSIQPVSANATASSTGSSTGYGGSLLNKEDNDDEGLSFQLATLDRAGYLNIWVVIEIRVPDIYGSASDLGLVPGGRVKLVKSASINVTAGPRTSGSVWSVGANCLQFKPGDTSHFYIGTETSDVCHYTRYGKRPIPKRYTSGIEGGSCDVRCVSFCPSQPDHLLAGCSDGSIRLHHIKRSKPLLTWSNTTIEGAAVSMLQWIQHRPGVFIVHDSCSTIYLWDLLKNDAEYIYKLTFDERLSCCTLQQALTQHSHTTLHSSSHTDPSPPKERNPPTLTLAHTNGTIVIHQLKDSGKGNEDKIAAFENYLSSIAIQ